MVQNGNKGNHLYLSLYIYIYIYTHTHIYIYIYTRKDILIQLYKNAKSEAGDLGRK